jgi:subtilisin family serine protease
MKTLWLIPAFVFSLALPVFAQNNPEEKGAKDPVQKTNNTPKPIEGQFIVVLKEKSAPPVLKSRDFKKGTSNDREAKMKLNLKAREVVTVKLSSVKTRVGVSQKAVLADFSDVVSGFSAKLDKVQLEKLRLDPDVAGVYQDYEITIDDIANETPIVYGEEDQVVPCAITRAGGFVDGSAKSTWIWILDTGCDMDHPDLNVQTSATYAKSFTGEAVEDLHGHGTHVAGIAAAKNNGFGSVGVSAGAKVVPVKVLNNSGSGSFTWLISALDHVAKYDIQGDVVNMSLGAYGISNCENNMPTLRDAIRNLGNAGTYVVMAAGNDYCKDAGLNLPGCINGNRVYTVGAVDCNLACAAYSNFSTTVVDWVAVGSNVYSTHKGGGYTTKSGTSMASPVVAGIVHAKNGAPATLSTINCCSKGPFKIAKR